MKHKQKKHQRKQRRPEKKRRHKRKVIKLRAMSKEELEDFQFEIRKALLHLGCRQLNGFRFEYEGPGGTFRYELTPKALQASILKTNWKRKGKYGNPDPYFWDLHSVGWYQNLRIELDRKTREPKRIVGMEAL